MAKKKITIIFVCYNCGADIASNIIEIDAINLDHYEINFIVFDNASSDNSIELIQKLTLSNLKFIISENNIGFGRACNEALKEANSDYYLLLNPDIKLFEDSISNLLLSAEKHPQAGIWGGITLNGKGEDDGKNAWREPTLWGFFCWAVFLTNIFHGVQLFSPDEYTNITWEESTEVSAVTGCLFLIDAGLWKKLNGFDGRFFMYSEEIDLCRRARKLGAKPTITNKARIVHYVGGTITSENKVNYLYKSKLIYFKKHWSSQKYMIARLILIIAALLRSVIYVFRSKAENGNIWMKLLINQFYWKI
jgi:GT2 family glycosyltransferase